jgi:hypothetical protein
MVERKKLAYGDGEIKGPSKKRFLAYTGLVLLAGSFHSCATASAIPQQRERPASVRIEPQLERACRPDVRGILRPGEVARESVCRYGREFVLTSTSMLIIERNSASDLNVDDISLRMHFSRTDMADIYARGLVDWEAGRSACFFLTADRGLVIYPNSEMGETVTSYTLDFETRSLGRNNMVYHSGFVFIAPPGREVLALGEDGDSRVLGQVAAAGHGFYTRGGRLFLGKGRQEREIIVRSTDIEEIEIR